MTCSSCSGLGTLVVCGRGCHAHDPTCTHETEVECEECEGTGRRCGNCLDPLPLCLPRGAELCRECAEAVVEVPL